MFTRRAVAVAARGPMILLMRKLVTPEPAAEELAVKGQMVGMAKQEPEAVAVAVASRKMAVPAAAA